MDFLVQTSDLFPRFWLHFTFSSLHFAPQVKSKSCSSPLTICCCASDEHQLAWIYAPCRSHDNRKLTFDPVRCSAGCAEGDRAVLSCQVCELDSAGLDPVRRTQHLPNTINPPTSLGSVQPRRCDFVYSPWQTDYRSALNWTLTRTSLHHSAAAFTRCWSVLACSTAGCHTYALVSIATAHSQGRVKQTAITNRI